MEPNENQQDRMARAKVFVWTYLVLIVCPLFIMLSVANSNAGGEPGGYAVVLTNLAIVPASCWALASCVKNRSADTAIELAVGTLLMCFSAIYHLYDHYPHLRGAQTPYRLFQILDFVFSHLIILTTTLFFADLKPFLKVKLPLSIILCTALTYSVVQDIYDDMNIVYAVAAGMTVILVRYMVFSGPRAFAEMLKAIDWRYFAAMLVFMAIGWSGQNVINDSTLPYCYRHSLIWHIFIMLVPYLAFKSKEGRRKP